MDAGSVFSALKNQVQTELQKVRTNGSQEFLNGNIEKVSLLTQKAKDLEELERSITKLQKDWNQLLPQPALPGIVINRKKRPVNVVVGMKTNARYFRMPILMALRKMGGSGTTKAVIDRVGEMLADRLNDYDKEKLRNGHTIRWRSTAAFVRVDLIKEGLLSDQSPVGIWELTQDGVNYLKQSGN